MTGAEDGGIRWGKALFSKCNWEAELDPEVSGEPLKGSREERDRVLFVF